MLFNGSPVLFVSLATLLLSAVSHWSHPAHVGWCLLPWVLPACDGFQGLGLVFLAGSPIVVKFQRCARLGSGGGQGHW